MTLRETYRNIICIFLFTTFSVQGQELDSLDFVYQKILDNKEFVDKIKENPELLCDSTLIFHRSTIWEPTNLTFDGKPLLLDTNIENCPTLKIEVNQIRNNRYQVHFNISRSFPPLKDGCFRILTVGYQCDLVTRRKQWKFKNIEVNSRDGLVNPL